jgi:hypothetical protein
MMNGLFQRFDCLDAAAVGGALEKSIAGRDFSWATQSRRAETHPIVSCCGQAICSRNIKLSGLSARIASSRHSSFRKSLP